MTTTTTTLTPIPCAECDGEGTTEIRVDTFTGWNGVVEPIHHEAPCERCDGTGEAACVWCGQLGVATRCVDGDPVCAACDEAEEAPHA